ncbi:RNI-like protein [Dothidotthia symphoricarpi CBS 119687]|uniref:RNI-like protein n=1 Tax=Dothidotthia symphoricarpi CBS 119687 TaxID=1392245 RepID=A0A6A6A197_9PLEO|nr:RNI-like protein [Dothidotthia symphoricarpi CBS 119687]KAF2124488.1 RNI-like protein [Dothidotthia symphoricarpi CBS 119687]
MRRHRAGGPVRAHVSPVPDPFAMVRAFDSDSNPARPIRPSPLAASTIQGLPLDLLDRLRSFPLFQQAPDSFLTAVGMHLKPQLYQPHDTILTEGETGKAMYWLVRGAVRVTSRDQESTFAELKPGAFFGEIGILMDIPRTATIIANMRSLVVRLNKEDLMKELPKFAQVERAIMDEAKERLAILQRKKQELGATSKRPAMPVRQITGKRDREDGDVVMAESGTLRDGEVVNAYKKRKSPSPGLTEVAAHSAFGSGGVHVRSLLKELPLFSSLPDEILHFLGMRAHIRFFDPFDDIIKQGSQGRDVYFIVKGEVEVVTVAPEQNGHAAYNFGRRRSIAAGEHNFQEVKARLKPGQYFGEVVSLSLAPRRTATVRSISSVECLMVSGDTLNQLWEKCTPDVRRQVESVAKERLQTAKDNDIHMMDVDSTPKIDELAIADIILPRTPTRKNSVPIVTFHGTLGTISSPATPVRRDEKMMEPFDPDPFLNIDLDNVRSRSRRGSLAPPAPELPSSPSKGVLDIPKSQPSPSPISSPLSRSPLPKHAVTPPEAPFDFKRPRMIRKPSRYSRGMLPDLVLVGIFQHLNLHELMRLRRISWHWHKIISTSPDILHDLDLAKYNRKVTDRTLVDIICPFVGSRPKYINISNCFHITDEGFGELAKTCAPGVKIWRMKSVWDITGPAVLEMVQKAKGLEEVDLSNCRKVGDNLLARVIGWVVPELPPQMALAHAQHQAQVNNRRTSGQKTAGANGQAVPQPLPAGTVVGCPKLRRLTLSYCKHITDRSMAHIAVHAANRIESIDLTRCTTITDVGFQHWSVYPFPRLTKLILADCTYLTDNAIVYLTNAAKGLRELDLSFCCALSDTATEVLALGLPNLTHLNLAFCGSAVSDTSLRCISLHLLELRNLSVRGCVRVTGTGVEAVVEGCRDLEVFDVSQCKNLGRWLNAGGPQMVAQRGRNVRFDTVADGRWRAGRGR